MAASFFFYDLETSGLKPTEARIMQFAGQRTDMNLQPVGEPFNLLIKLTDDVLPDPEAILLTGITPQMTIMDGLTEAAFLEIFSRDIATPGTIFVGYNTVRFDDEFLRACHYRNFYDPYEWHWQDDRSRWDLLDLVRMTRALRPEGIHWPVTEDGTPTNRLELLTSMNGLDHAQAHDALSDVQASILIAQLIRSHQPKLFDYLLSLRTKAAIKDFLKSHASFVYTSGKYANQFLKTTVVQLLSTGDDQHGAIVFDLRYDPTPFAELTPRQLAERWGYTGDPSAPARLPIKTLKYNRCPAISPLGVLRDEEARERLNLDMAAIEAHRRALQALPELRKNIVAAQAYLDSERESREAQTPPPDVDTQVHGGLLDAHDRTLLRAVRAAEPIELPNFAGKFHDGRLSQLLPRYQARNFPGSLTNEAREAWEAYKADKLFAGGPASQLHRYFDRLKACAADERYRDKQFILEELQLYGQSILPSDVA